MALPYRIRTQPFTYAIFGVLIGTVFILWVDIAWSKPESTNWQGAVAAGSLLAAIWLWFFMIEVDLYADRLVVTTLFGKRTAAYSKIRKTEIIERHFRGTVGRCWAFYDTSRFANRPLTVPIAPFRVRDQRKIAEILVERATVAHIDAWTRSMARSPI